MATNGGFFGTSAGVGKSYSLAEGDGILYSPNLEELGRSGMSYYATRCAFGASKGNEFDAFWVYKSGSNGTYAYSEPSPNSEGSPPQPIPNATFPTDAVEWDL